MERMRRNVRHETWRMRNWYANDLTIMMWEGRDVMRRGIPGGMKELSFEET
jgi:hypothetical protein